MMNVAALKKLMDKIKPAAAIRNPSALIEAMSNDRLILHSILGYINRTLACSEQSAKAPIPDFLLRFFRTSLGQQNKHLLALALKRECREVLPEAAADYKIKLQLLIFELEKRYQASQIAKPVLDFVEDLQTSKCEQVPFIKRAPILGLSQCSPGQTISQRKVSRNKLFSLSRRQVFGLSNQEVKSIAQQNLFQSPKRSKMGNIVQSTPVHQLLSSSGKKGFRLSQLKRSRALTERQIESGKRMLRPEVLSPRNRWRLRRAILKHRTCLYRNSQVQIGVESNTLSTRQVVFSLFLKFQTTVTHLRVSAIPNQHFGLTTQINQQTPHLITLKCSVFLANPIGFKLPVVNIGYLCPQHREIKVVLPCPLLKFACFLSGCDLLVQGIGSNPTGQLKFRPRQQFSNELLSEYLQQGIILQDGTIGLAGSLGEPERDAFAIAIRREGGYLHLQYKSIQPEGLGKALVHELIEVLKQQ